MNKRLIAICVCALAALELGSPLPGLAVVRDEPRAKPTSQRVGDVVGNALLNGEFPENDLVFTNIEDFVEGIIAAQFQSHDLAGATIAIVDDGAPIFLKGFGYSNIETGDGVDPISTLFRPGSISKLFTWTAVMQLVEQGKIDLDEDVNSYLSRFQIPGTFDTPVTMRNLLTHTPGFEDGPMVGLFLEHPEDLVPLEDYLKDKLPARVRAPGTYMSYSNYGTALAGLIVSNVSGMPFDDYIEEKIFGPLDMNYASFREPLPEHLQPHMATGYYPAATTLVPRDFEYIHSVGPAGAMSASAGDMAKFMIAHLDDGGTDIVCIRAPCPGARILKPETARLMREQLFTQDPRLPGVAHGFWEVNGPTMRTIGHGGDTIYFHSQLIMVPEQKFGLFVSYNAPDGAAAASELADAILQRYFTFEPVDAPIMQGALEGFEVRMEKITGLYRVNRRSFTKVDKVASFGAITVKSAGDGLIDIFGYKPMRLREVEPFVFEQVDGPEKLIFETDGDDKVIHAFIASIPFIGLDKLGPLDAPNLHALVVCLMMIVCVFAFYKALRHPGQMLTAYGRSAPASAALLISNLLVFAFVIWFSALMAIGLDTLVFGYPPAMPLALTLPVLAAPLTILTAMFAVSQWQKGTGPAWGRIKYTANVALLIVFFAVLKYWNLLGWNL